MNKKIFWKSVLIFGGIISVLGFGFDLLIKQPQANEAIFNLILINVSKGLLSGIGYAWLMNKFPNSAR